MKRIFGVILAASLLTAGGAKAGELGLGLGAFGGACIAISQDDAGDGFIYGARLPVRLLHLLTVEGFYEASNLADASKDSAGTAVTIPGFDLTAYGANAILGAIGGGAIDFYPYVGIGSYKLEQSGGTFSSTNTGWSFGLGLGLPLPSRFSIQIRAEADVIVLSGSDRTFGLADAGLNYRFGH